MGWLREGLVDGAVPFGEVERVGELLSSLQLGGEGGALGGLSDDAGRL